ncbi:MAG: hypothetical protein ACMUEM_01360 [Flavobacteriales bacterium AspAUS03]
MSIIIFTETSQGEYKKNTLEAVSYAKRWADIAGKTLTAIALNSQEPSEILYKYRASKLIKIKLDETQVLSPNTLIKTLFPYFEADQYFILSHTVEGSSIAA